jgi:NADPH2:quinone reductase
MSGDAWRIIARQPGGPEVLEREAFAMPTPGPGEVRVRNTAIGVNYIDTYHRSGLYPAPAPIAIGSEAAGIVEAVGHGVEGVSLGQRVAYLPPKAGTYATHSLTSAERLYALPGAVDDATAAASLLKGLTAWMLVERCARVEAGQWVLVHAAAGGVGSIAVQWLKAIGARVIAHAGTEAKAAKAMALGADHALTCPFDALADAVRERTEGRGVDTVFDGVGATSWAASLASLARRGLLVSYGNASGPVPPVAPLVLSRAGSLFLTRPTLYDYLDTADARATGGKRLFALLGAGMVKVEIGQRFALADAAEAHRALESRQTTGSTILIP